MNEYDYCVLSWEKLALLNSTTPVFTDASARPVRYFLTSHLN